jgi:hypothetical protein
MKTKYAALVAILAMPLLSGCLTLHNSKSIVIHPQAGETAIAVTANATAKCYNVILFDWCKLWIELETAK